MQCMMGAGGIMDGDIAARVERLKAEMAARELDAVLLDDCEILHYYTGYEVSLSFYRACIITASGEGFFVLRALDVAPLKEKTWIKDVTGYPDWVPAVEAVGAAIEQRGLAAARIGIDLASHALTVQTWQGLQRRLPEVRFVDLDNLPWRLRRIKSPAEIEKLRRASAIADEAIATVVKAARPGITERQAAAMAVETFVRRGGDPGLMGIITAGKEWDFLHGHLHDRPLETGEILHLELCPRFEGYSARIMRCVVIGRTPPALQQAADTLRDLQDRQIAALVPGARASDVDRIMRQGALDAGLRRSYDNITGYTLGFYSDLPLRASDFTWVFHPKSDWVVEEGMAFHMYASAAGIAFSETVVVGPTGPERLTLSERRLFATEA